MSDRTARETAARAIGQQSYVADRSPTMDADAVLAALGIPGDMSVEAIRASLAIDVTAADVTALESDLDTVEALQAETEALRVARERIAELEAENKRIGSRRLLAVLMDELHAEQGARLEAQAAVLAQARTALAAVTDLRSMGEAPESGWLKDQRVAVAAIDRLTGGEPK